MVNIAIYIILFIIGTLCGSFLSLAIYRIPIKQDITHKRSYCPSCNHRLGFWDLIPIFSYIGLKGKCRYCHNKIGNRYFLLEFATGILFVLYALSIKINFININEYKIASLILGYIYIVIVILIAGIDKNKKYIDKSVLVFGILISVIYMAYLYFRMPIKFNLQFSRYVIYISVIIILCLIDIIIMRKKANKNYCVQILMFYIFMCIFSNELTMICIAISLLIASLLYYLILKIKQITNKTVKKEIKINIHIGYLLGIINIFGLIITNLFFI